MDNDSKIEQTFKVFVDSYSIINLEFISNVSTVEDNIRQAALAKEQVESIFTKYPDKKFNAIVDLSFIKQGAHYPSPQAKKLYFELMNNSQLNKIAYIAPGIVLRSIMSFILQDEIKSHKLKIFEDKATAIEWLGLK